MNIRKLASIALATIATAFCMAPAHATLILTLDMGNGNVTTITDNGGGDGDDTVGSLNYYISSGLWKGSVSVGYSNAPGENGFAFLDLTSTLTSMAGGTIIITLTDTGFTTPNGLSGATTSVGGISTGRNPNGFGSSSTFTGYVNGTSVGTLGTFGSGVFGGTTGTNVDTTGGFTLTQVATITHTGAGVTFFGTSTSVPEPATLGLLGLGLLGLGFVKRRRAV